MYYVVLQLQHRFSDYNDNVVNGNFFYPDQGKSFLLFLLHLSSFILNHISSLIYKKKFPSHFPIALLEPFLLFLHLSLSSSCTFPSPLLVPFPLLFLHLSISSLVTLFPLIMHYYYLFLLNFHPSAVSLILTLT